MKTKVKIILMILIVVIISLFATHVKAGIEMKENTTTHTNITLSEAYQYCYNLRRSNSTLGVNTLDPHLMTNADWGAVVYLGMSSYGNETKTGFTSVKVGNATSGYHVTTKNLSGVRNYRSKYIQTASYIEGSESSNNTIAVYNDRNTKYVDFISSENTVENTKGLALAEIGNNFTFNPALQKYVLRDGYGINTGVAYDGRANTSVTFRPAIWN